MAMRQSKRKRPRREDKMDKNVWPLEEGVFDRQSLLVLERFTKKGIFRTLDYCIAEGKEANVYRGTREDGTFVAIKMYRLRSPSFVHMSKYIEGDRRFSKISRDSQSLVRAWTQKEFRNLEMLREAGVHVPEPITFKANVLAMEFLGLDGIPYSRLSDIGSADPEGDYARLLGDVQKMRQAGLVHGDLSEFNILMTDAGPFIIDCGQAVLTSHPRAEEFYARDLYNLWRFFSKYPDFKQPSPV